MKKTIGKFEVEDKAYSIWKSLKNEKPSNLADVIVLTRSNKIEKAFYSSEEKCFYPTIGFFRVIHVKKWCYENELVEIILKDIQNC